MDLDETKTFQNLKKLFKSRVDLRGEVLTKDRIQKMALHSEKMHLFYSLERVDDTILNELFSLAKEQKVLEKMEEMQQGEILNLSEKRAVLHTATRDLFGKSIFTTKEVEKVRKTSQEEMEKLEAFLNEIKGFDTLVQIGIGGSELGPKAIYEALPYYKEKGKKVIFLSNIDGDEVARVLNQINLETTIFVSVSKSGSTMETIVNEKLIRRVLQEAKINPKDHFVVVTSKKSPMDNPSSYRKCFYLDESVGGRYSATSMVGGVALAFGLGFSNFKEVLKGAHEMDLLALKKDLNKNISLLASLFTFWNATICNIRSLAILPYTSKLNYLLLHLKQLEMESNGKNFGSDGKKLKYLTAPILFGGVGTDCQHSFFQLIHQGSEDVAMEFIASINPQYPLNTEMDKTSSEEKLLSNLFAQAIALAKGDGSGDFPGNKPSHIIVLEDITPYTMGHLFAFYEHKTTFEGFLWGLNSFDQPGVELGKKLTKELLAGFNQKLENPPLASAFFTSLNIPYPKRQF